MKKKLDLVITGINKNNKRTVLLLIHELYGNLPWSHTVISSEYDTYTLYGYYLSQLEPAHISELGIEKERGEPFLISYKSRKDGYKNDKSYAFNDYIYENIYIPASVFIDRNYHIIEELDTNKKVDIWKDEDNSTFFEKAQEKIERKILEQKIIL